MTKEEAIYSSLLTKLSEIRTENGYKTDIGLEVEDWGDLPLEDDITQKLIVRDTETEFTDKHKNAHNQDLSIEISAVLQTGEVTRGTLRKVRSDIYRCLGLNEDYFWDTYSAKIRPVKDLKVYEKGSKSRGLVKVFIIINYTTSSWTLQDPEY